MSEATARPAEWRSHKRAHLHEASQSHSSCSPKKEGGEFGILMSIVHGPWARGRRGGGGAQRSARIERVRKMRRERKRERVRKEREREGERSPSPGPRREGERGSERERVRELERERERRTCVEHLT